MLNKNLLNKENKNTCHPELVSGSTNVLSTQLKSAAMFGLDARIALAIFGALSVITGAALFSAIENSKATALLTEMQEVGKAWEAYYLDTGKSLPQVDSSDNTNAMFYVLQTNDLLTSAGKGPYLKYSERNRSSGLVNHPNIVGLRLITLTDSTSWGSVELWNNAPDALCPSKKTCYLWVSFIGLENDSFPKILDNKFDNGDGGSNGNIRWRNTTTDWKTRLYYKYAPIKNPND